MKKLSLCLAISLGATAAQASGIPRYDAEGYCRQVSDISGGSEMIFGSCVDMEQDAYDRMKGSWSSLPSKAASYCDQVARVTGGSYALLESCIDMETDAADSAPTFRH